MSVTGENLTALLEESLALWGVEATVERCPEPAAARIRTHDGLVISVERCRDTPIFRWNVHAVAPDDDTRVGCAGKPRRCGSVVGVLAAVRDALGVERGAAVRVG